jgi:CDP-diacylglycerol---serine O-phosphatidyltransferase
MISHDQRPSRIRMLTPLRRRTDTARRRRFRRGVYLLPSMFTMASMFCGYACIVYAMRGEFAMAAPFIGWAIVADMFDGRIARMTGTESAFGLEFDSLADIISFGIAPAILSFAWGLHPLGRLGWGVGFVFVAAAAIRLARFNIQSASPSQDKRYFVGMPSPAAAGIPAATVYMYPYGFQGYAEALPVMAMVLIPAVLMVSTVRFRGFKTVNLQARHSYAVLVLFAIGLALLVAHTELVLIVLAYGYLASAFIEMAWHRFHKRPVASKQTAVSADPARERRAE